MKLYTDMSSFMCDYSTHVKDYSGYKKMLFSFLISKSKNELQKLNFFIRRKTKPKQINVLENDIKRIRKTVRINRMGLGGSLKSN